MVGTFRKRPRKQFSRPSIELGETKRAWQHVEIGTVEPGDILAGEGRVNKIQVILGHDRGEGAPPYLVIVHLGSDEVHIRTGPANVVVHAFTRLR